MEFLFFIVIGVIFVVRLVMRQVRKDDSSGPSLWGSGAAATKSARPQPRPRPQASQPQASQPQTSQPKNLEEALRLSEDRSAPPAMRYAGLDHDDDGPADVRSSGAAAPDDIPVMAEPPRAEEHAPRVPEDSSDPATNTTVGTEPAGGPEPAGAEPADTGAAAAEPAGTLRPSEPFTPAYSASVYTPTSLYTSGTSILDGEKQAEPGEGSDGGTQEHQPEEDQQRS